MPTDSLFSCIDSDKSTSGSIDITFDDTPLRVPKGVTVAAALLLSGVRQFRTSPVGAQPRAPYCMMGVCFECLVEIDGVPSRQSCLVEVADGMTVRSQQGARDLPFSAGTAVEPEVQHES